MLNFHITKNKYKIFYLNNFLWTSLILAHSAQLAQSAQFYLFIFHFNQNSKSVKMCKKFFNTFLHLLILNF